MDQILREKDEKTTKIAVWYVSGAPYWRAVKLRPSVTSSNETTHLSQRGEVFTIMLHDHFCAIYSDLSRSERLLCSDVF